MNAAALPLVRKKPLLKIEQPQDGPGDNRGRDAFSRCPLSGPRHVKAKPCWFLLIDVGEFATFRENVQVGIDHNNLRRRIRLSVREAQIIYPAKRCRPRLKFPNKAVSIQLPAARASDAVLQNVILLGGRKFTLMIMIHVFLRRRSFTEKSVRSDNRVSPGTNSKSNSRSHGKVSLSSGVGYLCGEATQYLFRDSFPEGN